MDNLLKKNIGDKDQWMFWFSSLKIKLEILYNSIIYWSLWMN